MAGFFGLFDYTKEGPGVDPDAPPKGAAATFFSVLGRKFWKIVTVNIMYVIANLPALAISFLVANVLYGVLFPGLSLENLNKLWDPALLGEGQTADMLSASVVLVLMGLLTMTGVGMGFVVVGPAHAGATYILRNYAREDHAFVWSDFIEQARKNWKQGAAVSLLSTVAYIAVPVAIRFYSQTVEQPILGTLLTTLLVILFMMFAIMIMYVYQMMVTFELTVRQMLKNSMLFFVLRLPFNILILALSLIIITGIPLALLMFLGPIGVVISIFYYLLIAFGLNLLLVNFFINRQLQRFMIKPLEDQDESPEPAVEADWEPDTDEEEEEEEAGDESEEAPGHALPHYG